MLYYTFSSVVYELILQETADFIKLIIIMISIIVIIIIFNVLLLVSESYL